MRKGRNGEREVAILTLEEDIDELEDLARSAGLKVAYEMIQRRKRPHPSSFVGKGKLAEVKEVLRLRPVELLIVNGYLKPSQHYLLESELGVECVDRVRLVLDIFSERAASREAQLQVQRAKLRYEIPLLREWIHNAKGGEHPGFLGGGEYETDTYYDLIRRQLARIEEELVKLGNDRQVRRRRRTRQGFHAVALAGYTNAGKSSLLNALTRERVAVEDRMFSTLSTTTGRLEGSRKPILITDTIGFLTDLPPFMIESFKSTLDEIFCADLVLLVIDATDDEVDFLEKLRTSTDILFPDVDAASLVVVLSKADQAPQLAARAREVRSRLPGIDVVSVSSLTGTGIDRLRQRILGHFAYPVEMSFFLPHSPEAESLLSWLHDATEMEVRRTTEGTEVSLRSRERDHAGIVRRVIEVGGRPAAP